MFTQKENDANFFKTTGEDIRALHVTFNLNGSVSGVHIYLQNDEKYFVGSSAFKNTRCREMFIANCVKTYDQNAESCMTCGHRYDKHCNGDYCQDRELTQFACECVAFEPTSCYQTTTK